MPEANFDYPTPTMPLAAALRAGWYAGKLGEGLEEGSGGDESPSAVDRDLISAGLLSPPPQQQRPSDSGSTPGFSGSLLHTQTEISQGLLPPLKGNTTLADCRVEGAMLQMKQQVLAAAVSASDRYSSGRQQPHKGNLHSSEMMIHCTCCQQDRLKNRAPIKIFLQQQQLA